jgi:hypothetical protein
MTILWFSPSQNFINGNVQLLGRAGGQILETTAAEKWRHRCNSQEQVKEITSNCSRERVSLAGFQTKHKIVMMEDISITQDLIF